MALRIARRAGCAAAILGLTFFITAQAQEPGPVPGPEQSAPLLSGQQLDDLVAPVALYPDPLLSQALVAATYPLEIVEAQQWMQQNQGLSGQQLTEAARAQNWDPSVQALVAFPDVLAKMNQDLQWTTALGNAFLAQQSDVMAAVQQMRARAQANGRLSTTPQETVTTEMQGGQSAIEILPADPQVIYVPVYDPAYVWGPAYYGYPSLYYGGYGYGFYPGINIGFCFGGWGGWRVGGWGWGWGPNWFGRSVFVNGAFFQRYGFRSGVWAGGGFGGRAMWQHDPGHRLGVSYPNYQLRGRYQAASLASRSAMSRGFAGGNRTAAGGWNRSGYAAGSGRQQFSGAGRQSSGQWQHFQGGSNAPAQRYGGSNYATPSQRNGGGQNYAAPSQRNGGSQNYAAPSQRYGGSQNYAAPSQRYGGGQSYAAPSQRYGGQSYAAPSQRYGGGQNYAAPSQRYGGGQSYAAPSQRYGGGQSYAAPSQRSGGGQSYSAPSQHYSGGQSSAPSYRSNGGGGGGGSHSGGGSSQGGGHRR